MSKPDLPAIMAEIRQAIEGATDWTSERQNLNHVSFDAIEAHSSGWRILLCADAAGGWPPIGTATHAEKFVVVNLPRDLVELGVRKARGET